MESGEEDDAVSNDICLSIQVSSDIVGRQGKKKERASRTSPAHKNF